MACTVQRALLFTSLLFPAAVLAHSGAETSGFMSGFAHPFNGVDHLLAMAAVGLLAGRFEGWRRCSLPLLFLCAMLIGSVLGMIDRPLPSVEAFIALSLAAFGVALLSSPVPKFALVALMTSAFAVFHGHAHATEMGALSPLEYSSGFLLGTALLHGLGLWLASVLQTNRDRNRVVRGLTGGSVAIAGLAMLGLAF